MQDSGKKPKPETVKVLMLGESGVGKSSILNRFVDDKFSTNFLTTLGVEYKQKLYNINGKPVSIQVWDTAGQEKFRTISPIYYRKVDGVVLVFDITDQNSFESVDFWMKNLADHASEDIKIILVGNKIDLDEKRVVTEETAKGEADKYNVKYFEASAKIRHNIKELFLTIAKDILEHKEAANKPEEPEPKTELKNGRVSIVAKGKNKDSKDKCC